MDLALPINNINHHSFGQPIQNTAAKVEISEKPEDPNTNLLHRESPTKTELLNPGEKKSNPSNFRRNFTRGVTLFGSGSALVAFLSNLVLGDKSAFGKAINYISEKAAALTFGSYGVIAAIDAYNRKDIKQVIPQVLAVLTPTILTRDYTNLTLNGGVDIGWSNVAAEAEKVAGKKQYQSFDDSIQTLKSGLKQVFKDLRNNPIQALTDFKGGSAGMLWGMLTSTAPIVFHLTGMRRFSTLLRQAGGLIAEGGKLTIDNLKKGRYLYWASGVLLSGSSITNLLSAFLPKSLRRPLENLTWVLNMIGKNAQVEAFNRGELTYEKEKPYQLNRIPQKVFEALFA